MASSSSSFGPPVARPSVWQNVPKDTLRWATNMSFRGGPALTCWVTGSSVWIGKLAKVNPLLPAINLITGYVIIKIFKRCNDHFNGNNKKVHTLCQVVGYLSIFTIQILAMGKCLGMNNTANIIAIPALLWANSGAMEKS
jgi:hypothetical protein